MNQFPRAPGYDIHRDSVTAADGGAPEIAEKGVDAAPYPLATLLVVPAGTGVSVDLEVLFWSPPAGTFVSEATPIIYSSLTSAKSINVDVGGRRFFVKVSAIDGGLPATATLTVVAASAVRDGGLDQIELLPGKVLYWDKDTSRSPGTDEAETTLTGSENQAAVRSATISAINAKAWGITASAHADPGKILLTFDVNGAAGNDVTLSGADLDDSGWAVSGFSGGEDATVSVYTSNPLQIH